MKRFLIVAILIASATPAAAQNKAKRGLVWDDRPTIVFGEDVNVAVTGRALVEWRWFSPELDEGFFALRAGRLGLKGDLTRHIDWEVEREVGAGDSEEDGSRIEFGDWKDVFVRWRTFDAARVKAGRFKIPFGLEQNTGVSELDFAYRALGSRTIAPGRDRGVMVTGELGRLNYEAGAFDDDGENAESSELQFAREGEDIQHVGPSFAVRVTGDLFRALPFSGRLRSANVGVAYTISDVPEGLNSLRGESFWGTEDFFERVYVKGRRQRFGAQFDWSPGPTSLRAEWMQSREQRKEQSNRDEDLSDFIANAWYVAGTWFVTGEDKDENVNARSPWWRGGPGAIELAVRYERLGFASASKQGTSFTNPRAAFLTPNSDTVLTAGVNWITSRWTRVIVNGIHEEFEDPDRTPIVGTTSFWSGVIRLNIVF